MISFVVIAQKFSLIGCTACLQFLYYLLLVEGVLISKCFGNGTLEKSYSARLVESFI
jgi:hypothetical protein